MYKTCTRTQLAMCILGLSYEMSIKRERQCSGYQMCVKELRYNFAYQVLNRVLSLTTRLSYFDGASRWLHLCCVGARQLCYFMTIRKKNDLKIVRIFILWIFLRNLKIIMKNWSKVMRTEKFFLICGENQKKYWNIFQLIYKILQKFLKNYEIPDLSELWTNFKDIVKKNLENFEYPLLQTLRKTRVNVEDT